jgi:hypothetical protein
VISNADFNPKDVVVEDNFVFKNHVDTDGRVEAERSKVVFGLASNKLKARKQL